jgi:hypothetical protein
MSTTTEPAVYGLLAEFENVNDLLAAVRAARREGFRRMDAYTPFPVEEVFEELGVRHTRLPWIIFVGGLAGALLGFLMQVFLTVIDYPMNIGGRPLHSWPAFIPVTFEMTILVAAFTAVITMLALNDLPRPYHPLFNAERFDQANGDRFFLCIESGDPKFDPEATKLFLANLHPLSVTEVPE